MSEQVMLDVRNLKVIFPSAAGVVRAVEGVDLTVHQGECVALVGESGCGKSVTSQAIMRLLESPPALVRSDKLELNGKELSTLSSAQLQEVRGKDVSLIFQDALTALNPVMTVGRQLDEVFLRHGCKSRREAKANSIAVLRLVGVPSPEARYAAFPHQLSGGMRQRVLIAMAFACDPKLIIADEPTTALDVTIQAQIIELMKSLQVNDHKSIILITHNMGLVAEMADEVCVMYMGRVMEFGSLEDIFEHPSHPYTEALLRSVPVLGLAEGQELETIPGITPNPADLGPGCEFAGRCPFCEERCKQRDIPRFEVSPGHYVRCLKYDSFQEVE